MPILEPSPQVGTKANGCMVQAQPVQLHRTTRQRSEGWPLAVGAQAFHHFLLGNARQEGKGAPGARVVRPMPGPTRPVCSCELCFLWIGQSPEIPPSKAPSGPLSLQSIFLPCPETPVDQSFLWGSCGPKSHPYNYSSHSSKMGQQTRLHLTLL